MMAIRCSSYPFLKAPLVLGSRPETDQQCPISGNQPFPLDPPAVHLGTWIVALKADA